MENPFRKYFQKLPTPEVEPVTKNRLADFLDDQFKETQDRAEQKNPGLFKKAWNAFAYDANTRIVTGALSTLASANPYAAASANIIRFLLGSLGGAAAGEGLTRNKFEKENIEKLKSYVKLDGHEKLDIEATKDAITNDLENKPQRLSEMAEVLGNLSEIMSEKGQTLEQVIDTKTDKAEETPKKDPFWKKHYDDLKEKVHDLPAFKKALIGLGVGGLGMATLPLSVALGVPTAVAAISGAGLGVAWANLNKENKKLHHQYEHADLVKVLKEVLKEKASAADFDDQKAANIAKSIQEAQKKYQNRKYAGLMKGALAGSAFVEGGQIFGGMLHSFSNVFQHGGAPVNNLDSSHSIPSIPHTSLPASSSSHTSIPHSDYHQTRIFDQLPKALPTHTVDHPHTITSSHPFDYSSTKTIDHSQTNSLINNLEHHPAGSIYLKESQYSHIGWIDHPNSKNTLHNISEIIVKSELAKGHFTSHHLSHERFNLAVRMAEEKLRSTGQFNQNGSLDMAKVKYIQDKFNTIDIANSAIKYAQRIKLNSVEHIHSHILPHLHAQTVHHGAMLSRAGLDHKLSPRTDILMQHFSPKLSSKYIQYEPFAPHYISNHQSPKLGPNDFYPVSKPTPSINNLPPKTPDKPASSLDFWPVKKSGN